MTSARPTPTAVVVVGYRSAGLLARNLAATDLAAAGACAVVVDNSEDDDARAATREVCARHGWTHVPLAGNPGFGAAVNRGAQVAAGLGADVLVLLNPDARADAAILAALATAVREEPDTAVSPRVVSSSGRVEYVGSQFRERDGAIRGVGEQAAQVVVLDAALRGRFTAADGPVHGWLTGACLAVTLRTFEIVGGFDPRFFLYWEDVDLSYRLARAGVTLQVRTDLTVVHDEGGTQGGAADQRARSDLYYRWNCRNRLLFAALRLPRPLALRWLLATPARSWAILLRGGRRQLLGHPQAAFAAARGSFAGAGWVLRALVTGRSGSGGGDRADPTGPWQARR